MEWSLCWISAGGTSRRGSSSNTGVSKQALELLLIRPNSDTIVRWSLLFVAGVCSSPGGPGCGGSAPGHGTQTALRVLEKSRSKQKQHYNTEINQSKSLWTVNTCLSVLWKIGPVLHFLFNERSRKG